MFTFSNVWHAAFDDLRLFALCQFLPLVLLPALAAMFEPQYTRQMDIAAALSFYAVAKVCEGLDYQIYNFTGKAVSGHALKHLFGACTPLVSIFTLKWRARV